MKSQLIQFASNINRQHVQLVLMILTLSMFVLAAGAPGAMGDFTNAPILGGH
ncbi:MAG: hypothetical protein MUE67_02720 [Anaerolineales bacterium]|nr:hypothetical protein [Anaerolineales bacterium]